MKTLKLLIVFILINEIVYAQKTPKSHFDKEKWVEYIEGNIPLVISVPHGGRVTVDTLPIRDCKDAVTGVDGRTIELSLAIKKYFEKVYKVSPHIIISHIARKHVDQNRELNNGAVCGYKQNEKPWYSFHNFIDSAINLALKKSKNVMYIDLHGHGHKNQRLEIGYNLNKEELNTILNDNYKTKPTSLNNLLSMNKKLNLKELIFGNDAFGTLLENNGLKATPSKQDLVAKADEKFFSGGDNTRRYTGKMYPNVYGLQIENDSKARAKENIEATAKGISESIVSYMNTHSKTNLKSN